MQAAKRITATALAFILTLGLFTVPPGVRANAAPNDAVIIVSFEPLEDDIQWQGYDYGDIVSQDGLNLPDTLFADDDEDNLVTISGVMWNCTSPEDGFDPLVSAWYEFAPELPGGFVLGQGVTAPVISVFIRPEDGVEAAPAALTATGNVFDDFSFVFDEDLRDINEDNLPYRPNSPIMSVRELYYSGMLDFPYVFGKGGALGKAATYANSYTRQAVTTENYAFKLPAGYTLDEVIKTYEGDFDGDGKKNELAVICATRSGTAYYMQLYTASAEDNRALTLVATLNTTLGGSKNPYTPATTFYNNVDVITADVNGDGVDEIIVARYNDARLSTYYNIQGGSMWRGPVITPFEAPTYISGLSDVTVDDLSLGNPGIAFSMAAGDINRDGCEDIVYIASGLKQDGHAGAFRSAAALFGTRGAAVPTYTEQSLNLNATTLSEGTGQNDSTNQRAFGRFGLTVADMENDGQLEILVAYMEIVDVQFNRSDSDGFVSKYYNVGRLDYTGDAFEWSYMYRSGKTKNSGDGGGEKNNKGYDVKTHTNSLKIARLEYDYGAHSSSDDGWGSIIVNGEVYSYVKVIDPQTSEASYTCKKQANWARDSHNDHVDIDNEVYSIRQASITGDGDGFLIHHRHGSTQYFAFYDSSTNTLATQQAYAELFKYTSTDKYWYYSALPDVDNDSVYLEYKKHSFFYADPVVLAALASPPYFGQLDTGSAAGSNYTNSSTYYGSIYGNSEGTINSSTINVGAYVAGEFSLGVPVISNVKVEFEVAYNHSMTKESQKMVTVQYTDGDSTSGGEDSVVLMTLPCDVYSYTMHFYDDSGQAQSNEYNVVVPYNSAQRQLVSYAYYEQIRANDTEGVLPDLSGVFTHILGNPASYHTSAPNDATNASIKDGSVMYYKDSKKGFPKSMGKSEQSVTITRETTTASLTGNSVSAKLGVGGEVVGQSIVAGVTSGGEWTKGKITSQTEGVAFSAEVYGQGDSHNGNFQWQPLEYIYQYETTEGSETVLREFPVVTYLIPNCTNPTSAALSSVTVGEQNGELKAFTAGTVSFPVQVDGIAINEPVSLDAGAAAGISLNTSVLSPSDTSISISVDNTLLDGDYPLTLLVGSVGSQKESEVFYLSVSPRKFTVSLNGGGANAYGEGEYWPGESVKVYLGDKSGPNAYQITYTGLSDQTIKIIDEESQFTFTMPYKDVTITASLINYPLTSINVTPGYGTTSVVNRGGTKEIWALFNTNGFADFTYGNTRANQGFIPPVTWTIEGASGGNTYGCR